MVFVISAAVISTIYGAVSSPISITVTVSVSPLMDGLVSYGSRVVENLRVTYIGTSRSRLPPPMTSVILSAAFFIAIVISATAL